MDHLNRLFRRGSHTVSIYEHIRNHLPPAGPGFLPGGESLPDEADLDGPIRWAPGAHDGVAVHHFSRENAEQSRELEELRRAVTKAWTQVNAAGAIRELEAVAHGLPILDLVSPLAEYIGASSIDASDLYRIGWRLATEAGKRDAVKLGIVLLGMVQGADSRELLMTLGRHEEFTLYSAHALSATTPDPEQALFELAHQVSGWGRIETVTLLRETQRRDIREWILREGFRNEVMNEYLAYIAATTGALRPALEQTPDDELLDAACEIVMALISGGPAEDIDDYGDAPSVIPLLVGHLERRSSSILHFLAIDVIEQFLSREDGWDTRLEHGWTAQLRHDLLSRCRQILSRSHWRDAVRRGLGSGDSQEFYRADLASRRLGLDTLDAHLRRLETEPEPGNWFSIMQAVDDNRLEEVLDLARRRLPLDEIGSGPANELGLGPDFAAHGELGSVVQGLYRFPGRGWDLIATALKSPVVNNRHMAVATLSDWADADWPAKARPALADAAKSEPDTELRHRMEKLMSGEREPSLRAQLASGLGYSDSDG